MFICLSSSMEIKEILDEKNYQFVSQKVNILSGLLSRVKERDNRIKQEVEEIPNYLLINSIYRYYIRLINVNTNHVIETDEMDTIFQNTKFFHEAKDDAVEKTTNWTSPEGKNYFLLQRYLQLNQTKWLIQVGLDTSYENDRLFEYKHKLVFIFVGGILMAFFLGFLITKKGMKKLYELTDAAKKVTSSSLHKRINPKDWPFELRNLGLAFNQMLDRLEEAFLRLTQFSSDLAHELRTPVNNLLGEIEIALSHTPSQGEYKEVLESNIEEVRRISHIIENLLFLARTENPKIDIKKVKLNLKKEISIVTNYYQSMADDLNVTLISEGEGDFYGNSLMIRRMMSNLISNSLKYSLPNKNIYISIVLLKNDEIKISIQDEGIGMSEEHLSKIFSRFYRVDCSRTQNSGGVGLGLPIVKSIVELHHGTIFVTSQPNHGTMVQIIFPRHTLKD